MTDTTEKGYPVIKFQEPPCYVRMRENRRILGGSTESRLIFNVMGTNLKKVSKITAPTAESIMQVDNREMAFVLIEALRANGILNQKTYENICKRYKQGDGISVYRRTGQEQIA